MSALLEVLQTQHQQLETLKSLLESELHHISSREPETLMAVLNEKQELLTNIEATDLQVAELYLDAQANNQINEEHQAIIDASKAMVEECKYLTQINAKSVEQGQLKLTHLRNMMVELRAKESMTYDKAGKTTGRSTGKGFTA